MKTALFLVLFVLYFVKGRSAADEGAKPAELSGAATQLRNGAVVLPDSTNAVQFRLYTNASPDSPHLFNTIQIEAYGEMLLPSPGGDALKRWLATSPTNASLHNILVNGAGPQLAVTNGMKTIEQASGPDWRYIALDASSAYR